ncbi:dihydroorotase [Halobacillus yeomjeoni]|uniref:dihydroorotase n=1 Tax=Halobacillus yeomjeoni TaxID=311194 RepID=UPI001CD41CDA|nr:dihydroorotase [Halobacillus yeomjeoni]MCA0983546.1 dihydroorotase [Halobacillus yeomjeoni]
MKRKIINAKRLLNGKLESCEVLIEDSTIQAVEKRISSQADETIDAQGHLISAGFVDVHVHLREPGGEAKETIETGTMAAAKGGFTTVCAMPNTRPVPDSEEHLNSLLEKIETTANVRVLPYASITTRQLGEELVDMETLSSHGAFAFTDDGVGVQSAGTMYEAMQEAARLGKAIVAHCEDNSLVYGGVSHEGEVSRRLNLPGIMNAAESVQIARDVLLAEAAGCHYHVCHVSTKESVRVIRDAKRAGINVTAEVTPHHLLLNERSVQEDDALFKMNPPLRSKEDQQALIDGLLDGTIDCIATDHAPHTEEEKQQGFLGSPFGITGLETAFPLLYTYFVEKGTATLQQLIAWLTVHPSRIFQLPFGHLEAGAPADMTLIDLETKKPIDRRKLISKGKNSPFDGWAVKGWPVMTMVEGEIIWEEAKYETARA